MDCSSKKKTNCPKCCPKQCKTCPVPQSFFRKLSKGLMDEFRDFGNSAPRNKDKCASSRSNKYYSNETFTKSDEKIPLTIPVALQLLKNWYREACYEAEDTLYDIKCIWNSTDVEFSKKISTTNRLFIYYLLILAIYIIHVCFLIDEKLFEGLCKILSSINAI